MEIVLVHGIWDSGRVFRRMSAFLAERGHHCFAPDLIPSNGRNGLVDLAQKLSAQIEERYAPDTKIALIGFSMGTLISRYYLQRLNGLHRVNRFFAISGPQQGTLTAHIWPGNAARDMRFGSRFLNDLNADLEPLRQISVCTYRTPIDLMIVPASSSRIEGARNKKVWAPLHHLMLIQQDIFQDIAEQLDSHSK